ncbi:MAG: pilus assembly protein PilP [Gallionellaceae bacterium]|nr:pilus assembly protein PilP [Gallionellaceae bacterium]
MRTPFLTPFLFCLALSGCSNDGFDDLRAFMESTGKEGASKIEPLPAVKKVDTFEYRQGELTDPFFARNLRPAGSGTLPDANRPREPLEEYPLDALRMVGTMKKAGHALYAVIKDPKGTLHTVKIGGHIGQNYGKVSAINEDGLEIKELIQDASGEWTASTAMMSMNEEAPK